MPAIASIGGSGDKQHRTVCRNNLIVLQKSVAFTFAVATSIVYLAVKRMLVAAVAPKVYSEDERTPPQKQGIPLPRDRCPHHTRTVSRGGSISHQ